MTATNATPKNTHQTMLAKLLAKENVRVTFGNYSTAFFEPKTRVLGLPMWNAESKQVSDLLVGHEVGHALYTPVNGIQRFYDRFPGVPFDIMNIIEDVRIERLIQSSYPGLVYSFREGYKHFVKNDLFKINGVDLSTLCIADRMNIHAKIGNLVSVPLSADERRLYEMAYAAETFDDVLDVVEEMVKMVKREKPKHEKPESPSKPSQSKEKSPGSSKEDDKMSDDESDQKGPQSDQTANKKSDQKAPSDEKSDSKDSAEASSNKNPDLTKDSSESDPGDGDSDDAPNGKPSEQNDFSPEYSKDLNKEFSAMSQRSLDSGLKNMQSVVTKYIVNKPSKEDLMRTVTAVSTVMSERQQSPDYRMYMEDHMLAASYKTFKDKTKKHVGVLVKEFERRKAAFQYSRAQRSTTGTIDVNRLHSYKYEDQIFKSVMKMADAKNHGMMFFIDYSGSMGHTLHLVIEQTLQLVSFCKAVNIPFEVYGFTSKYANLYENREEALPGYNVALEATNVFEILNSTMRKHKYETAVKELYAIAYARRMGNVHYTTSHVLFCGSNSEVFGGTPLCETILVAHELVRRFREKHNVQRMNTIFLTDGDPCAMFAYRNNNDMGHRKNTEIYSEGYELDTGACKVNWTARNPKEAYVSLIRSLRKNTGSTVIGYFIADNQRVYKSIAIDAIRNISEKIGTWDDAAEVLRKRSTSARRNGVLDIPGGYGHDMFFAFDDRNNLDLSDEDDEFESELNVDDGFSSQSSQNKLAKEFVKYTSDKKTSRVFLNKFSELIA